MQTDETEKLWLQLSKLDDVQIRRITRALKRKELLNRWLTLQKQGHTGNKAAAILGRSASYFVRWRDRVKKEGDVAFISNPSV